MAENTILVVDDEQRMRKLVRDFLTKKDFQVLEAADGEEAIDVFMENKDKIKSIDVVEFNPLTDIDNKTLRITVELIERIIEKLKEL